MGSWNKTCGISNLPITYQTPVLVFVLERQLDPENMCYSTCLYRPVPLPFYSVYNDYGAGEQSSGPFLNLIIDSLKDKLIEMEQGKNPYYDIAIKRDAWNEKLFWDAIHKDRLRVKHYSGKEIPIDAVMFREDIVKKICQDWTSDLYADGKRIDYKLDQVLEEIPLFVTKSKQKLKKLPADLAPYMCRFETVFSWEERNLVSSKLTANSKYSQIAEIEFKFFDYLQQGNDVFASLLLAEHLKARWLDEFMNSVRKLWVPGGFEGSQSQDPQGYRLLTSAINTVLDQLDTD